jgi:glycosyltransferase involved in cell wall biosynthesis
MKSSSYWLQGLEQAIAGSDIVVAPQELQCLTVPYLWMRRNQLCHTWIWWGHGYNFQAAARPSVVTTMKERMKEFVTRRGDGLLTYTERGADYWRARGVPDGWARPYYNTIDVEELRRAQAGLSETQRRDLRRKLMLEGKRVLLFSGRLYADKKVDFLLRAYAHLKSCFPDVGLLILGDGEERDRLQQLAKALELQDVHFLGEVVNPKDTAGYFSLADLMVIPGLVGLAIVHGFAFGLPLITTDFPGHSPELEYLTENNGIMTAMDTQEYAKTLEMLLSSPERLEAMKHSAMAKGDELQLGRSVHRFIDGMRSISVHSI